MLEAPHVTEAVAQPAAVIHLTVPHAERRNVVRPAVAEIMAVLDAQGLFATGPVFSHHLRMDPEVFDFEIGLPVSAPITPVGRVKPGELPGGRVARAVYRGGYEGLSSAWSEFDAWIAAEGHRVGPNLWERYVRGPESGPELSNYRTELNRPLLR